MNLLRSGWLHAATLAFSLVADAQADDPWARQPGAAVVVTSAAEFQRALTAPGPEREIALAPGIYPRLAIRGVRNDAPLVIRSQDTERPAVVAGFDIVEARHIWLQSLMITPPRSAPARRETALVDIRKSRDIVFVANHVFGSVDGNYGNDADGIWFQSTDAIVFADNELHDLGRGVKFEGTRDVRVAQNRFYDLRSDGADFAGVQNVTIEDNFFARFHPDPADHPDFIQFWTRNALIQDTHSVVIRNNVMLESGTARTQAIFIGNEMPGWVYRDFVVENNVIYNSSAHGISFYDVVGGRIAHNTVVMYPGGDPRHTPRINLTGTRDVEVVANVVPEIQEARALRTLSRNNLETRRAPRGTPLHPEQLFQDPLAGQAATKASFAPRPNSRLLSFGTYVGAVPPPARQP